MKIKSSNEYITLKLLIVAMFFIIELACQSNNVRVNEFDTIQISCCLDKIGSIDKNSILIKKINQHAFLEDHGRALIIKAGDIYIDKVELYGDPGEGCNAYLSENNSSFVLIDCNGEWYSISKSTGKIKDLGWKWKEKFPESYVGVFRQASCGANYSLSDSFDVIYKFKDPPILLDTLHFLN